MAEKGKQLIAGESYSEMLAKERARIMEPFGPNRALWSYCGIVGSDFYDKHKIEKPLHGGIPMKQALFVRGKDASEIPFRIQDMQPLFPDLNSPGARLAQPTDELILWIDGKTGKEKVNKFVILTREDCIQARGWLREAFLPHDLLDRAINDIGVIKETSLVGRQTWTEYHPWRGSG